MRKIARLEYKQCVSKQDRPATKYVSYFIDIAEILYIKSVLVSPDRKAAIDSGDESCEIVFTSGHTITVPISLDRVNCALVSAVESDFFGN